MAEIEELKVEETELVSGGYIDWSSVPPEYRQQVINAMSGYNGQPSGSWQDPNP